jgi:hypothetical protein
MLRRILLIVALGAALAACSPSTDSGTSPGTETLTPIVSLLPDSMAPETIAP